jgi:hypothetical protein
MVFAILLAIHTVMYVGLMGGNSCARLFTATVIAFMLR